MCAKPKPEPSCARVPKRHYREIALVLNRSAVAGSPGHRRVVEEQTPLVVGDRGPERPGAGLGRGVVAEAGNRGSRAGHAAGHKVGLAETGCGVLVEAEGDGVDAVDPRDRLELV